MDTLRTGINDPTNILGIADLVKETDDIMSEVDIGDLEKQIVNRHKGKTQRQIVAPDKFRSEIEGIVKGMKLDNDSSSESSDEEEESSSDEDDYKPPKRPTDPELIYAPKKSAFQESKWYGDRTQEEQAQSVIKRVLGNDEPRSQERRFGNIYEQQSQDQELEKMIAQEQEQDLKAMLLAQYDLLRNALEEERVDISRVPVVNEKSPIQHINASIRMLRHKNDLRRYVTLGEDFILMIAAGLETAFDGETNYFGVYPDLSGWSDNVKPRIRRMRADTSAVVSSVMNGFNMGALTRMGLELVPSAILYSRTRRSKQKGQATESEWKDSIHHIDDIDKGKK